MTGKKLKISNNDLYGNQDERQVAAFVCFNHLKYMNNYVIFSFVGEYDKNILYYGSIHLKTNSLVIFAVKENEKVYIDTFREQFLTNTIDPKEYQIIDISQIEKVELVSFTEVPYDKISILDNLTISKPMTKKQEETKESKPFFLYFLLIVLIAFLSFITYLKFNPNIIPEPKALTCTNNFYNQELKMNYEEIRKVLFNPNGTINKIDVTNTYTFPDEETYLDFKNNDKETEYFKNINNFEYLDDTLSINIYYEESTIIETYDDMYNYLKKEGYECLEGTNNE